MLVRHAPLIVVLLGAWVFAGCQAQGADQAFSFRDVGDEVGLYPDVAGLRAHGIAWGDATGNGWPDLFICCFHDHDSKPALLFLNDQGKFKLDTQEQLHTSGAGSGALFVDLTNNGRLDLYVSNCVLETSTPVRKIPGSLFRNDGNGKFTDISKDSGAIPLSYQGRGLSPLDADGDGLLDLALCEQYYSSKVKTGARLLHNQGNYKFADISEASGIPPQFGGLSLVAYDVNNDTWPDLFLNHGSGDHQLLLNDGHGKFAEAPGTREVFKWVTKVADDAPAGTAIGDVNRDGWPDIVIGNHFHSPWEEPAPIKLYLNRGLRDGKLTFEDVSESVGITPLAMRGSHVEIQDFDNDGWPDVLVSIVKFKADGTPCPVIFKNLGVKDGLPHFRQDAWAVNDFPTDEERGMTNVVAFQDKMVAENRVIYTPAGSTADYDRDGKVDICLPNWWIEKRSLLLRNETDGGNWLDVIVQGKDGVNRMGVGSRINVYPAGKLKDAKSLLGDREISIGQGYCSGQEGVAHFGLGPEELVDVEVILPNGKGTLVREGVKANQRIVVTP